MDNQTEFIVLNKEFLQIMPDIKFRFTYKSIIIDLLDYFPFLKEGKMTHQTIGNIIVTHKWFNCKNRFQRFESLNNFINNIRDTIDDNSIVVKINDELIENLKSEKILSEQLRDVIVCWHVHSNRTNDELVQFLICCSQISKILHTKLIESNDYIRLIWNIINNDVTGVVLSLLVEELDPRIGYNDLYKLALLCEKCNIKKLISCAENNWFGRTPLKFNTIFEYIENDEYCKYPFIDFINDKYTVLFDKILNDKLTHVEEKDMNYYGTLRLRSRELDHSLDSKISDLIKEVSIKRNWMEKQVIIKNIEESQSTTANDIFNHLNNFR